MVRRLIVGITGASGVIHGIRLLETLRDHPDIETHLVLTRAGERTIVEETAHRVADVRALAAVTYPVADIGASIASGSFQTAGMVVIPCSIHTLSAVAYCHADNLLTRAADVTLKERRRLVLVVRETPLHRGHLVAMLAAAEAGAVIMPPMPGFYGQPKTVDDLVNFTVGRVLDLFDIEHRLLRRWGDSSPAAEDG
jgi:flavin prenyltransferase